MKRKEKLAALAGIGVVLIMLVSAIIASCGGGGTETTEIATGEPIELSFGYAGPPPSGVSKVNQSWIATWEEKTGGKIKINYFPGGALGKDQDHYDLAANGLADITSCPAGSTPGRFPLVDVSALPFIAPSNSAASRALQGLYDEKQVVRDHFNDVHVLYLSTPPLREIWTREVPVHRIEDLNGLKIKIGNEVAAQTIELLKGTPVMMSSPETYSSLEKQILDGCTGEWNWGVAYKITEVTDYVTILEMDTAPVGVWMNIDSYNNLPSDVRAALDEISGMSGTTLFADNMLKEDAKDIETIRATGINMIELDPAEKARFREIVLPLWDKWVDDMDAKGYPGQEILDTYLTLIEKYS